MASPSAARGDVDSLSARAVYRIVCIDYPLTKRSSKELGARFNASYRTHDTEPGNGGMLVLNQREASERSVQPQGAVSRPPSTDGLENPPRKSTHDLTPVTVMCLKSPNTLKTSNA